MKVLSLFDGMACGMLAMTAAGVKVDRYVAYEIDKYAVQTSTHNFPMIEHRGDVFVANFAEFEGFDFLVGGSPCTYWSIAQKNNRETEASGMGWELFSQYVRALREAKPAFFIYENNKSMAPAIRASISEAFGFDPICINSALVSAQNRQRLYWVGRRNPDGTYSKVDVKQPADRGILLRQILERETHEQSYEMQTVGVGYRNRRESDGKLYRRFETHGKEKANALTTVQTDSMVAEPIRLGDIGSTAQAHRVYSCDGKSVTLNAGGGGQGGKTGLYFCQTDDCTADNLYNVVDGMVSIKGRSYPIKLADGLYIIRKLTVLECQRLQTVPDEYEFPVSNAQAYKMLGNGWTVEVIRHLIASTLNTEEGDEWMY